MKLSIDNVKKTVYSAYDRAKSGKVPHNCACKSLIDYVLDNTHLTYKYILVTALASKATDPSINPLCLQVKSKLPGAYDARSICHGVIVRFDMEVLNKALGGSNEPFLNKPARFPELSTTNAVRKGRDQSILNKLCSDLPLIDTAQIAFDGLTYAIHKLLLVKAENEKLTQFTISSGSDAAAKLLSCINTLLAENHEGEILTLVVAGLYDQFLSSETDYKVEVHPVNQAGASSKEISDLDIYYRGSHYVANELKDKPFSDTDMIHAADKVMATGKMHMNFIVGRHGSANPHAVQRCTASYLRKGFIINVIPIDAFVPTIIGICHTVDCERFAKYILKVAMDTKFKEVTIEYVVSVLKQHFKI
jgi:hypothetical protein